MEPFVIRNFYSSDLLELLQLQVDILKNTRDPSIDVDRSLFFRRGVHNPGMFKALHNSRTMAQKVVGIFPEKVKPSYVYVSMYEDPRSICPLHTDRPQCKYTIDLCISQGEPWEIFVNDVAYLLNPGDALCYSGTDHPHYRNKIKEGNFCNLAFFHFVPENFTGGLD